MKQRLSQLAVYILCYDSTGCDGDDDDDDADADDDDDTDFATEANTMKDTEYMDDLDED